MKRRALFAAGAAIMVGLSPLAFATSCASSYDPGKTTAVYAPDYEIYKTYLDDYLNRRCGTLDCHGHPGRAYRSFGSRGLRLPTGTLFDSSLQSGVQATTENEKRANFQGIIALEPEQMSRVIAANGEDPLRLLFLRKPLGLDEKDPSLTRGERHKGGQVIALSDPGYNCLIEWLKAPSRTRPDREGGIAVPDAGRRDTGPIVDTGIPDVAEGGFLGASADLAFYCEQLKDYK